VKLRNNEPDAEVDDIDHLGNRRLRTIDELASDEFAQRFPETAANGPGADESERPGRHDAPQPGQPKSISAAIEYFFGRGELSQVVDQTNPLSMLTHERRLSAFGPRRLEPEAAGFEVRDVHISHYGRICPIETPEGTNIGLISSLAIYAGVDEYGFLVISLPKAQGRPLDRGDRVVAGGPGARGDSGSGRRAQITDGRLVGETIIARHHGDFQMVPVTQVEFIDVAPAQMVGVSAA